MSTYQIISSQQAQELIASEPVKILDMRDHRSYRAGHIDGALLLHDGLEKALLDEGEYDRPLLVYCYRGVSSKEKALYLARCGFSRVYTLDNGFTSWPRSDAQ